MKFLRDIWRGEYSLAKVFWVYNILVGVISGFILSLLEKTSLNFGESNLPTALLSQRLRVEKMEWLGLRLFSIFFTMPILNCWTVSKLM